MVIDEQALGFYDGATKTAFIGNQEFNINRGRVNSHLIIGVHKIEKLSSDITIVRFIGEE